MEKEKKEFYDRTVELALLKEKYNQNIYGQIINNNFSSHIVNFSFIK